MNRVEGVGLTKARIVIADDDLENAKIVEEALKAEGHQTRVCGDGKAAIHLLKSWQPHLLLLDINMPKLTGLEALKTIRSPSTSDYVGVILVTGNSALGEIVSGLDAGADDYIVKPYRIDELKARVRSCLRTKGLQDALRRANKRLEEASFHDDLTSLYNMRFTTKRLTEEVDVAKKGKAHLSCIMFDMDHFKTVNDKHDHLFGSHVLREVAQVILPLLRPTDIAARYGGDEYFVVLPGFNLSEAQDVAERIRKTLESYTFTSGSHSAKVTASFGISGTQGPEDFVLLEARELIRTSDSALYAAKNNGRNRIEVYGFIR